MKTEKRKGRLSVCLDVFVKSLLASLPNRSSPAYGWAMELAELLNQTKPCEKCEGKGTHDKHMNCRHSHPYETYINGCFEQVICRNYRGTTRVLL